MASTIQDREAIAVSDGSFKDQYGTAAWIIEGCDHCGKIVGKCIAPGGPQGHSPYWGKWMGFYATMLFVNNLCKFYYIIEGTPTDTISNIMESTTCGQTSRQPLFFDRLDRWGQLNV